MPSLMIEAIRREVVSEQAQKRAEVPTSYHDNWGDGGSHTDGGEWGDCERNHDQISSETGDSQRVIERGNPVTIVIK